MKLICVLKFSDDQPNGDYVRNLILLLCVQLWSGAAMAGEANIQQKFELSRTGKAAAYEAAQTEIKASEIYNQANREDRDIISKYGSYINNWVGKIDSIRTEGVEGAEVVIKSPGGVTYETDSHFDKGDCPICGFEVSSISTGSSVYKQLSNLKEGDSVRFSGRLIMYNWIGLEGQSLSEPAFSVRFDSIQLGNNLTKIIPTMTKKRSKN
jgi:hypothetical protein